MLLIEYARRVTSAAVAGALVASASALQSGDTSRQGGASQNGSTSQKGRRLPIVSESSADTPAIFDKRRLTWTSGSSEWWVGASNSKYSTSLAVLDSFADPSFIQIGNKYYAYATNNRAGINVQMAVSSDFKNWQMLSGHDALPSAGNWTARNPSVWAPDVRQNVRLSDPATSNETDDPRQMVNMYYTIQQCQSGALIDTALGLRFPRHH